MMMGGWGTDGACDLKEKDAQLKAAAVTQLSMRLLKGGINGCSCSIFPVVVR